MGAEIRGAILELGVHLWVARYAVEAVVPAMHGQWSYAAIEVAPRGGGYPIRGGTRRTTGPANEGRIFFTIPRLELSAAVLSTRMWQMIEEELDLKDVKDFLLDRLHVRAEIHSKHALAIQDICSEPT